MAIKDVLDKKSTHEDFNKFIDTLKTTIGTFGGRRFYLDSKRDTLSFNDLVNQFKKLPSDNVESNAKTFAKLIDLDKNADSLLNSKSTSNFQKIMTIIKQLVGNLGHNREKSLSESASKDIKTFWEKGDKKKLVKFLHQIENWPKSREIMIGILNDYIRLISDLEDGPRKDSFIEMFYVVYMKTRPYQNELDWPNKEIRRTISEKISYLKTERSERRLELIIKYVNENNFDSLCGVIKECTEDNNDIHVLERALDKFAEADINKFSFLLDAILQTSFKTNDAKIAFFKRINEYYDSAKIKDILSKL